MANVRTHRQSILSSEVLVHLVAALTAAMGVINVLSAVTPSARDRLHILESFSPLAVTRGGHLTAALAGFALMLLSVGLWRRKRLGWLLTMGVLSLSVVAHLIKGLDYEEALLAAALAVLLLYLRPQFHARTDEPSIRQGLLLLAASLGFTLAYGVLGFYLLDRHYSVRFGFWAAIRQTVVMFTQFYDPGLQPITGFGRYFAVSIYVVGAVTFGYALLMLLRPVLARRHATEEERARAWEIVRAHGRTSLARYSLLDDKFFYFSAGGSLISYVLESRVAVALGDPIGPAEDVAPTLASFKSFCASNDWLPAFYQIRPDHLSAYQGVGFNIAALGSEAIVDLGKFTLEGSENKTLRNTYNKMLKNGAEAKVLEPPYSPRMLHELRSISDDWLSSRGMSEMRFSLGWFDEAYLNTCPILIVRDREGFIDAFSNIVTEFQANEVTVDLMRHHVYSEKGIMDFLFVSLFKWAREQGYATFNLGLSALAGVGEDEKDPAIERALNYAYNNLNRFYNFKGLHAFKEKFHPVWSPRYLAYPGIPSLPLVMPAVIRANVGGGLFSKTIKWPK
jgi:phosphatidylglycerol lysyltransferase